MRILRATISPILFLLLFSIAVPLSVHAENISELHILPDGSLSAKGVVVTQKAGANFFCRVAWGDTFIRLTVLVHDDTAITRKYGGKAVVADMREGDKLEVAGLLSDGTGNLIINAKKVVDLSLTTEQKNISGTVTSIDLSKNVLGVTAKGLGSIKVALSTETPIQKGVRSIQIHELAVGDKVLSASGVYDYPTVTLNASSLEIYQDKKVFSPRSFEGTLVSLSGTVLPASAVVSVDGKTYTMYLSAATKITNKARTAVVLSRVAVGDKVSILGSVKETNLSEVSVTSLRDLAF